MDCEQVDSAEDHQISEEMQNVNDVEGRQDTAKADSFIEKVSSMTMDASWNLSETQLVILKSDPEYNKCMEDFNSRLRKYEERDWDEEEQEQCMEQIDTVRMAICRTGPLVWSDNEALVLMICAGLISRFDPLIAAGMLEVLLRWTNRRQDPIRMHELLTRAMFEEVLRLSLVGKLHFRSDYGGTLEETFCVLQKRSRFFHMAKEQLHETIDTILKRLKFRKFEFILNILLRIWYLYSQQDESDLEFFRSAYFEYRSRFMSEDRSAFAWDTELLKFQEHDPFGAVDFYTHDPLELLRTWAAEDDISANERFHSSSKPISDPDLIEREFNPTIQNQCLRELCLMAAFSVCDRRTADVFGAIKSLGIGESFEKMYLEEWCSRHPCYAGPESVRTLLLAMNPCNHSLIDALNILHRIRRENPVLSFRTNTPLQETSEDLGQGTKQTTAKRACGIQEGAETIQEGSRAKKSKKAASQDLSNQETELDNEAKEQAQKAVALRILYRNLHSVDVQHTSWACLLSVACQLHPGEKHEILDFIKDTYKIELSALEKNWDAKTGLCLDWGRFLRQHIDVKLSGHELITKTLPAMFGSSVLMFGILDQQGCKVLRFLPDFIPFKTSDLNLNTGLINCNENLNLNLVASIEDCSDYALAEKLIKQGFNKRLGFYEDGYYQFVEANGAWDRIEKDQAQSVTREELTVNFSRTLHLIAFRGVVGLKSRSATALHKMMTKYCGSHQGVGDVLKAVLPKIRFEPPNELPHLACFKNGLVDLRTKTLLGPASPGDYVIQSIPHLYDPNADQSIVKMFVESLFPETVYDDAKEIWSFFQMHAGSFLTRENVMPAILILVGEGSNGKSKYCEAMRQALGTKYHATISAEALEKDPGENNDNLYRARLARCATIMEIEKGKKLSAKMVKSLTGGDITEVSAKFKNGLEAKTEFTMHIFANDVPQFTAETYDDFALARRIAVVPMRVQFLDDNDTTQREKLKCAGHEHWACRKDEALVKLLINNGITGLLAYMVDGAAKLFAKDCKPALPPTIWNATNQEKENADELIRDFVGTQLTRADGSSERTFISTEEMTEVYKRLHHKESCLLKSGSFASKLKAVIGDVFIKQQVEGSNVMVVCSKKKGAPSPLGPRELRGYFNLLWKYNSDGAVEAEKLRKTYADLSSTKMSN